MTNKNICEKLRKARTSHKYLQKYVAEMLEIKPSKLSSWECGTCEPNLTMFFKLCEFYGIKDIEKFITAKNFEEYLNYIQDKDKFQNMTLKRYTDNDIIKIETASEESLITKFRKLDARGKLTVMNCLDFESSESNKFETLSVIHTKPQYKYKYSLREIKIYEQPAAAGLGNYLDNSVYTTIEAEAPVEADVGIKISGDSMQPRIKDGNIVWVKMCETLDNGDIGIFILNGNAYCKILRRSENEVYLESVNKSYSDIKIREDDSLYIFGKVLSTD